MLINQSNLTSIGYETTSKYSLSQIASIIKLQTQRVMQQDQQKPHTNSKINPSRDQAIIETSQFMVTFRNLHSNNNVQMCFQIIQQVKKLQAILVNLQIRKYKKLTLNSLTAIMTKSSKFYIIKKYKYKFQLIKQTKYINKKQSRS